MFLWLSVYMYMSVSAYSISMLSVFFLECFCEYIVFNCLEIYLQPNECFLLCSVYAYVYVYVSVLRASCLCSTRVTLYFSKARLSEQHDAPFVALCHVTLFKSHDTFKFSYGNLNHFSMKARIHYFHALHLPHPPQ